MKRNWFWSISCLASIVSCTFASSSENQRYAVANQILSKMATKKAIMTIANLSLVQCMSACLREKPKSISQECRVIAYKTSECQLFPRPACKIRKDDAFNHSSDFVFYYVTNTGFEMDVGTFGRCDEVRYTIVHKKLLYTDAVQQCIKKKMQLATPKTPEQHERLATLLLKSSVIRAWIGVQKLRDKFLFVTGEDIGTERWGEGQPNNSGGTQNCVEMLKDMKYLWNDVECNTAQTSVCQHFPKYMDE